MKTHSNWSNNSSGVSNLYYTKEETINSVKSNFDYRRFYSAEGCASTVDGIEVQGILQDHGNPLNADRTDKKFHVPIDTDINLGSLVVIDNQNWLVVSDIKNVDGAYLSTQIVKCNYNLKFQDALGVIITLPAIFEQKSNTVQEGKMLDVVDGVGQIKIQFDSLYSDILTTNTRLMIDSRLPNVSNPNCYRIVKSVLNSYDGGTTGLLSITVESDSYNSEKDDKSLGVCDKFTVVQSSGSASITYDKTCELKQGSTAYKVFTGSFYDSQSHVLDLTPIWNISSSITGAESLFTTIVDSATKTIKIKALDTDINLIGSTLTLNLTESTGTYSASLVIGVISL